VNPRHYLGDSGVMFRAGGWGPRAALATLLPTATGGDEMGQPYIKAPKGLGGGFPRRR